MARFHLGPRTRKVLYYGGLVVLAILTMIVTLQRTFPWERVRIKIEDLASSKVDLTIEEIEPGWLPGVIYLKNVTIKTRPKQEDLEKAYALTDVKERDKAVAQLITTVIIDRLRVNVHLIKAITGNIEADIKAYIEDGVLKGMISYSKDEVAGRFAGSDLPSERLPMREAFSNLPMSGNVDLDVDFSIPFEKLKSGKTGPNWPQATGELSFECPANCQLGDGKAKLKLKAKNPRQQAMVGEGTAFGPVLLQSFALRAEMKDSKLELTKFEVQSTDVELHVEFVMNLQQALDDSTVTGCVRYKGFEPLQKRNRSTYDQILFIGGKQNKADNLEHVALKGTWKDIKKLPELCGPGVVPGSGDSDTAQPGNVKPVRPNLTVTPDEPTTPTAPRPPPLTPPSIPDAGVIHDAPTIGTVGSAGSAAPGSIGSAAGSAGSGSGSAAEVLERQGGAAPLQ